MAGLVVTVVAIFLFSVTVVNFATTAKGMLIYLNFTGPMYTRLKAISLVYLHIIDHGLKKLYF